MLIFIDSRIPEEAKAVLSDYGSVIEIRSSNIVYDAISGHPDIFICNSGNKIIVAPNAPENITQALINNNIEFITGNKELSKDYPETALYNAVVNEKYLIHRNDITDETIINLHSDKKRIDVNQGYTRCNLIALDSNNYITSDKGIYTALIKNNLNVLLVTSEGIVLKGYKNGFFGGTCGGVIDNKLFICGSLEYYIDGLTVRDFVEGLGYKIIELYDGPLFDCGGILFVEK